MMGAVALTLCAVAALAVLSAQRAPRVRVSPHETHTFTVEGADITITYGRPTMRGRKIFGGLVRYDIVWMPGADEATIVKTSAPLQFGDFKLPKGAYSLYTLPSEKGWTLIVNAMTGQFHTYYPADRDLAKIPMTLERPASPVEQLTISAVPRPRGGGVLQLEWELTRVSAPFVVLR